MRQAVLAALGLVFASFAGAAQANGVISEFPAGGVIFKDSADIAMSREDLVIGLREIRVHYVFTSSAKGKQTHVMGFPMPAVPLDESPDHLGGIEPNEADPRNYMHFSVTVDHRPVTPKIHEYALLGGKNVTADLAAFGIPPLVADEDGRQKLLALPADKKAALKAKGLVDYDDSGQYGMPNWQYQAVYEWSQDFAPGDTDVTISYVPLSGSPSDIGEAFETGRPAKAACGSDALKAELAKRRAAGQSYYVATISYILQTAKHWNGPIGEFNLAIDATDPLAEAGDAFSSFCLGGVAVNPAARHEWHAKDFVPDADIKAVFYYLSE